MIPGRVGEWGVGEWGVGTYIDTVVGNKVTKTVSTALSPCTEQYQSVKLSADTVIGFELPGTHVDLSAAVVEHNKRLTVDVIKQHDLIG